MSSIISPADLVRPEHVADPYPAYDALRPSSPMRGYADYPPGTVPGQDEPTEAWVLLKYRDVEAAARDHRTFSSENFQRDSSAPSLMLVNHDEPRHGELRRLVSKAFTPKRIADIGPWVDERVHEMLDRIDGSEVDVLDTVAADLPGLVMVQLIGLPAADAKDFKRWANAFMLSADMTPDERNASNLELATYFATKVGEARAALAAGRPVGGLLGALLEAADEGRRLTDDEVTRFLIALVVAGSETTMYLIGNAVALLADRPDVFARLKADRSLVRRFLDETLRLTGPPQRLFRVALHDVEIGGVTVKQGEWVALFFGAANHDPDVFPSPHEFDLDRGNAGEHLSYGIGIHYCLGAPLADLEVGAVVSAILDRYEAVEPGAAPRTPQTASLLQHGCTALPVRFRRAGGPS